jgi:SAM-dependent methyltransferase
VIAATPENLDKAGERLVRISCPICDCDQSAFLARRFDSGSIVSCSRCGHAYLNPTLSDEALMEIYRQYHVAANDDEMMVMIDAWFHDPEGQYKYAIDEVEKNGGFAGKKVLEVGCGPGHFLNACAERGAHVTGFDISPGAKRLAKERFGLELTSIDLNALPEPDSEGGFDFVFAFEIIEHVRRPVEFLRRLKKFMVSKGRLFISTPNFYLFHSMGSIAPALSQCAEHLHYLEPQTLASCLEKSGLRPEILTTLAPLSFGDRQKQSLTRNRVVGSLWRQVRKLSIARSIKDAIFGVADLHHQDIDEKIWNGRTLMCIAEHTTGGAKL